MKYIVNGIYFNYKIKTKKRNIYIFMKKWFKK